ncbi:MAG: TIGR01777 family oxidoreductase [Armatimonadetes bacterium]|nr:TIGR01777 family oxidoreductase [Armatimonadota bacterium]
MNHVVIAGGTGFVGRALAAEFLERGTDVVILSRGGGVVEGATTARWDGNPEGEWTSHLDGAKAVVNLCGAAIANKWTAAWRDEVYRSRVEPTEALGKAVAKSASPPKLWINASGVGYYGNTGDTSLSEASPAGKGFLAETCVDWESACLEAPAPRTHKLVLRLGVVLAREGGAFVEFKKIPCGGIGSGRQWISWVHLDDVRRMVSWAVDNPFDGAVNCCAPDPVTNAQFFRQLGSRRGLPPLPPMPEFVFRAAAAAMGKEASVVLEGQRVSPVVAQARGFNFQFPDLQSALDDLL